MSDEEINARVEVTQLSLPELKRLLKNKIENLDKSDFIEYCHFAIKHGGADTATVGFELNVHKDVEDEE